MKFLDEISVKDYWYASEVVINLPGDRSEYYMESNYDNIVTTLTKMASIIAEELGVTAFKMELPVLEKLKSTRYDAMFLGLLFDVVIFVLFALSITLIYSLLMLNIDTKKFEFGILRSLGLSKIGLV